MINVGVIGCGYWGPNLIRNFVENQRCSLKTVADISKERLEFISNRFPGINVSSDINSVLEDNELDAIIIATPVNTHKELAINAIRNGKHVFVEKPLTGTLKSADELLNYADSKNKIVAVGHIFQFAPAVTAMKKEIHNNLLGDIYHFKSQRVNLGPPKTTVDVVWDLGPHDISILLYLFDESPNYVNAYGSSCWWDNIIDNAEIFLKFPSNRSAHIHLSWLSSKKMRKTFVFGRNGNLEYDETLPREEKLMFYDRGIDNRLNQKESMGVELKYGLGEIRNINVLEGEPLALEVDAFLDAIEYNSHPINDGKIGREVVCILEDISNSIRKNK